MQKIVRNSATSEGGSKEGILIIYQALVKGDSDYAILMHFLFGKEGKKRFVLYLSP